MPLSDDAQAAFDILNSTPGTTIGYVDTYNEGRVAQVAYSGDGLLIVPSAALDELIQTGSVVAAKTKTTYWVHDNEQFAQVPADALIIDTKGDIKAPEARDDSEFEVTPPVQTKKAGKK